MAIDKKHIHYFSETDRIARNADPELFGIRARLAVDLSEMDLPVLPGVIYDSVIAPELEGISYDKDIAPYFDKFAQLCGKKFGDSEHPLLIKIVISPNMVIAQYPLLHNIGLARDTADSFSAKVGADFTANELSFLVQGMLKIEKMIADLEENNERIDELSAALDKLSQSMKKKEKGVSYSSLMQTYEDILPAGFFDTAAQQACSMIERVSYLLSLDEQNDQDTALLIHPMVYGNYTKNSCSGACFSRNVVTGDKQLQGQFFAEAYNELFTPGQDISSIDSGYYKLLTKIAGQLEDAFKDIRQIRFTIENGKLWLIEQKSVEQRSTAAQIMLYMDLLKRELIDEKTLIHAFKPSQLSELLHPVIDESSVASLPSVSGGISGAPGAAVGRVYFSTDDLLEARLLAHQKNEDERCILLMSATYAGDVKAIEQACGVLSHEGGYSAHASVVARQYGKISLVRPDMKITGKKAVLGDLVIEQGDYLTLNVPYYGTPTIYKGQAKLTQPDPDKLGLFDVVEICRKHLGSFTVRANADSPRDADLALKFGADGIGLCRTEHMFFHEDRINVFRSMVLAAGAGERAAILEKLKTMQTEDFYGILKVMAGKHVTIRLLDAPLHEFLPHNDSEFESFVQYVKKTGTAVSKEEIKVRIDAMAESNPMLGHRGCRIAVSYPEIYAMQIRAVFEAACRLHKEKIKVFPEIMIPLIMNSAELKLIMFGKKIEGKTFRGLIDIAAEVCEEFAVKDLEYRIGTMIELPCAALGAGEIARYAQFFSFGTNDLSQTTLGLSRDDFNSFMPDYTMFDLIEGNPFATLDPRVKELVSLAAKRGRATRPDLSLGLCGEHGARQENIKFCMDAGLDYVSCSAYSVPIALLSVAQLMTGD